MLTDTKPDRRIKDPEIFGVLRLRWKECVLCGAVLPVSLHHIYNRDDIEENLVMLCGDGVSGCHGAITLNDPVKLAELGWYLLHHRPDTLRWLELAADPEGAEQWIRRRLLGCAA